MNRIITLFESVMTVSLVGLAGSWAQSSDFLVGFDKDAQAYILNQAETVRAVDFGIRPGKPRIGGMGWQNICEWLVPFCTNLGPYLEKGNDGTPEWFAAHALNHFKKAWIPDGWEREQPKRSYPNTDTLGFRIYRKVPNTIWPIKTHPNGNPVYFTTWEFRKGDVRLFMLYAYLMKPAMLIVAHKDGGVGPENPTVDELIEIAGRYFNLPPDGMIAPKGWVPMFEVQKRDGRFVSGIFAGKYEGKWNDREELKQVPSNGGSWGGEDVNGDAAYQIGSGGRFFYDGTNLALLVTPLCGTTPCRMAKEPEDIDWDAVEKRDKEEAEKEEQK